MRLPSFSIAELMAIVALVALVPKQALYINGAPPTIHASECTHNRWSFHAPEVVAPVPHG